MAQESLDDLMDTRAEIRKLRKRVDATRSAYSEAKSELAAATSRAEEILVQIEHHQGRLSFPDETPPAKPKRGKRGQGDHPEQLAG
jgi:chromosome segregation ATPase